MEASIGKSSNPRIPSMSSNIIERIDREQMRYDMPDFRAGDSVRVHIRIIEGNKERVQVFEGVEPLLPCARSLTVSGLKKHLPCILPGWKRWKLSPVARFAVQGSTICVNAAARLPVLKKKAYASSRGSMDGSGKTMA